MLAPHFDPHVLFGKKFTTITKRSPRNMPKTISRLFSIVVDSMLSYYDDDGCITGYRVIRT